MSTRNNGGLSAQPLNGIHHEGTKEPALTAGATKPLPPLDGEFAGYLNSRDPDAKEAFMAELRKFEHGGVGAPD